MTKLIAVLALLALTILNNLGSAWYVYGLWPHSWGAVLFFTGTGLVLWAALRHLIFEKD